MKRLIAGLFLLAGALHADVPNPDPARFANEIAAFDAADQKDPPEKGGIVFTGSSSIRLMNLPTVFPGLKALNRGFGGSEISDVNHYLDQCVLRYEPKLIVFYCGGNDLWDHKTPEQVDKDFKEFRTRVFERLPKAKMLVMAVRPTPSRTAIRDIETDMNKRFAKAAKDDKRIVYIAGSCDRYLDAKGQPIPDLFVADGLHMTPAGYAIWHDLLTPYFSGDKQPADEPKPEPKKKAKAK